MLDIAGIAKQLHSYFPHGYIAIDSLLMVYADGRSSFGYELHIQQINLCKQFKTFVALRKYAEDLILMNYAMEKPLTAEELLNRGGI